MKMLSKKSVRWTATAAYALVLLYLSVMSTGRESPFPYFDLLAHFAMYFGMAVFLSWSLKASFSLTSRGVIVLAFVMATLYGFMNETIQIFIPTRDFEYADLIANAAGAMTGATLMVMFRERLGEDEGEDEMEDAL
jgi:VanZ family protein